MQVKSALTRRLVQHSGLGAVVAGLLVATACFGWSGLPAKQLVLEEMRYALDDNGAVLRQGTWEDEFYPQGTDVVYEARIQRVTKSSDAHLIPKHLATHASRSLSIQMREYHKGENGIPVSVSEFPSPVMELLWNESILCNLTADDREALLNSGIVERQFIQWGGVARLLLTGLAIFLMIAGAIHEVRANTKVWRAMSARCVHCGYRVRKGENVCSECGNQVKE